MLTTTPISAPYVSTPEGIPAHWFDEDGFLISPDLWTTEMAQQLAYNVELGALNRAHWDIINFLRDRFLRLGAMPPMRRICREFGYKKDAVKGLFGGCRNLWQIAGLPNPGEEAKAYMD